MKTKLLKKLRKRYTWGWFKGDRCHRACWQILDHKKMNILYYGHAYLFLTDIACNMFGILFREKYICRKTTG